MSTAQLIPMWSTPVIGGFAGAAQFGSTSTITLESRVPNIFGNDGDYVQFDFLTADVLDAPYSLFGSTVSPDEIYTDLDSIFVRDGTTTAQIDFDSSLVADTWYTLKLYNDGGTLKCTVDSGSGNVIQIDTATPVPVDLDIIGKNQAAYTDVIAVKLAGFDGDYLHNATPSAAVQGGESGWWRSGWIYLDTVGDHTIADCLSGNNGWRIEVENVYLSAHRLVFKIGNGTEIVTLKSDETFSIGRWIGFYVDLEDLGETTPDAGDTTIEGFTTESGDFYVGATRGISNFFDGKIDSLFGGDGNLITAQVDWLENSGHGRVVDEIGAGTTVATADIDFGWAFDETTGTRVDSFGTDDLTEFPGTWSSGGFEEGDFSEWTTTVAGSSTINIDAVEQRTGSYCARADLDGSSSDVTLINYKQANFTQGKEYTLSIWAKSTGSVSFRIQPLDSATSVDKSINSATWTEFTHTYTDFGGNFRIISREGASQSVYYDDITVASSAVISASGLRTSFTNAAAFTGYLRDVKLNVLAGYVELPLSIAWQAQDIGGDSNDGTVTNITFVTDDPGA